jgi:stalled ribosome alternative rescue factor ArfA|tara:strand:+ start:785 stop:904 length:120 start_codon:yes stop_codon:yes gene_type:complete
MAISLNKKKNNMAKLLKDAKFKQRVIKSKKGKGSFKRKK